MTGTTGLAEGFPRIERSDWHARVAAALARSRADVTPDSAERHLASPTEDGYSLLGLYTAADIADRPPLPDPGVADFVRGATGATGAGWSIRQRYWLTDQDPAAAVADDLANGVDGLWLTDGEPDVVQAVLTGIDLAAVPVVIDGHRASIEMARAFLRAAGSGPIHPESSLGLDPLGLLAAMGRHGDLDEACDLAQEAVRRGILAYTIDGTVYHDAGGSFAEELGSATAAGLATLRALIAVGIPMTTAARLLEFRWAVSDDQFASIAKLRAARILWSRVLEVVGAEQDTGQRQHAVTSYAMLTSRDPWVNLVRNCVAAFAGGVGGAAAVTVLPHTLAVAPVDDFARRMARNTQHLLLSESHAGFVSDAAGGSYYVEARTRLLAEAAWSWLQEIEAAGGLRMALDSGMVAEQIDRTWQHRRDRLARRSAAITGVSEFPDREREPAGAAGWQRPGGGLPQHRLAEDFEDLRDRADRADPRPTVALITLGPLARHGARESFAANLFAAGGIDTVAVPFTEGQQLQLPPGTSVACLCGADADYEQLVGPAAAAARAAGVTRLWLAGKPGARHEADTDAGVSAHLYAGGNAITVLERTLADLGVAS